MVNNSFNQSVTAQKGLSLRLALGRAVRTVLLAIPVLAMPIALETVTSVPASAAIQFTSDFEDGDYEEWRGGRLRTPWAIQIVPGYGTNRTKVARFENRNTDVIKYDTEKADLAGDPVPRGSDQWYAFEYLLPNSFQTARRGPIILQVHGSSRGTRPPIALRVQKDRAGVDSLYMFVTHTPNGSISDNYTIEKTNLGPISKNVWQKVVMRVIWEANEKGRIKLYIDGQLKFKYSGVIGYNPQSSNYPGEYVRIGIYLPNNNKVVNDYVPVSVAYFDNFKMGPTLASVDFAESAPPPDSKSIRVEAENMSLADYRIESGNSAASGRSLISLRNTRAKTDTASSTFSSASGKYDVYVGYFDENDGIAKLQVSVGGVRLANLQLDQDLGDNYDSAKTLVRKKVASGLSINRGTRIEIKGTANKEEWARVDYIEFVPVP